jgi:4'-phosphopantetheinyl transferase
MKSQQANSAGSDGLLNRKDFAPRWASTCKLYANEIHVWKGCLDIDPEIVRSLQQELSGDEQARASRYYFRKDRERFIVARSMLRQVLGAYLGVRPSELEFIFGTYGKPRLAGECNLEFNLSHSGNIATLAVGWSRALGMDVEVIRGNVDVGELSQRFFSASEIAELRALPTEERVLGFFNCWTRKEAYIKGIGIGLSLPLDSFGVSLSPRADAKFLHGVEQVWSLESFSPAENYVAAIAVAGAGWKSSFWEWKPEIGPSQDMKITSKHWPHCCQSQAS